MTFYDLLKEKARGENASKIVYIENKKVDFLSHKEYSYVDLYNMVNEYIETKVKNINSISYTGKKVYLIIDNSISSIVAIIALLKCGYTPILLDYKNIAAINSTEKNRVEFSEFPQIYPYYDKNITTIKDMYDSLENSGLEELSATLRAFQKYQYVRKPNPIDDYIGDIISVSEPLSNRNGETIVICSSGSEGKVPHFNELEVSKIIENDHQYGENGSTFLSYISCANISGILTNIINPLINDTRVILASEFDINLLTPDVSEKFNVENPKYVEEYPLSYRNPALIYYFSRGRSLKTIHSKHKIIKQLKGNVLVCKTVDFSEDSFKKALSERGFIPDSVMLPRDIGTILSKLNVSEIDLSNLKHIYLAGGSNSYDIITAMRTKFPSIRPNVFENLYGATEAYGVICSCPENELRTCYIKVGTNGDLSNVIYTYDKNTYYRFFNGKEIEVDKNGFVFSQSVNSNLFDLFFPQYLSVSSKRLDDVIAGNDLSLRFKRDGNQLLNDVGIYIKDQLYVLSRSGEAIKPNVELISKYQTYYLNHLESLFRRVLGTEVYCVNLPDGKIQAYVNIGNNSFPKLISLYSKFLECMETINHDLNITTINYPVFLHSDMFPISEISGKISKGKLAEFQKYALTQKNNLSAIESSIRLTVLYVARRVFTRCSATELDDQYRFKIKINSDRFFFPIAPCLAKFFKILQVDDEKGEINFEVNRNILFITESEIRELEVEILSNELNAKDAMRTQFYNRHVSPSQTLAPGAVPEEETKKFYLRKLDDLKKGKI